MVPRMLDDLAARGPDDARIARWDNAILGSCRLSIFDTSEAGRQPMVSADLSVGVVLNGSVYNFRSLRKDLERAGAAFKSCTDTEVLLQGYLHWGVDRLVSRLEGMFAFAIWDNRCRKMILVRDRLGVKPLSYASVGNQLAFASTPRALVAAGIDRAVNANAVLDYLNLGYVPDNQTVYRAIQKVPAGSILEWRLGTPRTRTYWAPCFSPRGRPKFEEAVREAEVLLLGSVRARLRADVPVGALLSGGIDSGLVCWAARHLGEEIPTFTLALPGTEGDEAPLAQRTASRLGLNNRVIACSSSEAEIDELVAAYAEPFASASALGMLQLARAARSSVKVLLTGEGGDEAFLGYPAHARYQFAQRLAHALPPGACPIWKQLRRGVPKWGLLRRGSHLLDFATGGMSGVLRSRQRLEYYRRHSLFGERLLSADPGRLDFQASAGSSRDLVLEFQRHHFETEFKGEFMTKVDASTMRHGIEARSPFLGREIWNFGNSLPIDLRLNNGELKAVLREIARRRVGPSLGSGPKRGFTIPVGRWLTKEWKPLFEGAFDSAVAEQDGWLRTKPIMKRFRIAEGRKQAETELWYLFIFERWLRHEKEAGNRQSASPRLLPEIRCCQLDGPSAPEKSMAEAVSAC
jgi:asparagine synthase (glutamine-hydrolysing)